MWSDFTNWLGANEIAWVAKLLGGPGFPHAIAFAAMLALFVRRGIATGAKAEALLWMAVAAGAGGVLMARLWYVFERENLNALSISDWLDGSRGTASWGAYMGVVVGLSHSQWLCVAMLVIAGLVGARTYSLSRSEVWAELAS